MMNSPLVSIIVNNYNYDRYVRQAIDSALHQSYDHVEVIIVDDGSTDNSKEIINQYTEKATCLFKDNGGQASAFNEGFKISKGDIILFLDADDALKDDTVQSVVNHWNRSLSKGHWKLMVIDEHGKSTGDITPTAELRQGYLRDLVMTLGPNAYVSPPTSGNAWSRDFLNRVLPMPEGPYKISADNYLCMLAPLYGELLTIDGTNGYYRLHGQNNFRGKVLEEGLLKTKVDRYDYSCEVLKEHLASQQIHANIREWQRHSWIKRLSESIHDITERVPSEASFILADADQWQVGEKIAGRHIIPFMEKENKFYGFPADDEEAIREINRHRDAAYIFFAAPVFWFRDHYRRMFDYLSHQHQCVIDNDRLIGYKLIR